MRIAEFMTKYRACAEKSNFALTKSTAPLDLESNLTSSASLMLCFGIMEKPTIG